MFKKKYVFFLWLVAWLFALSATSALANYINSATATVNCNSYSLTVNALALTPGEQYTIAYTALTHEIKNT
jgi:hypothetical protein